MSGQTELIRTGPGGAGIRVRRVRLEVSSGPDAGRELATSAERIAVGTAEGNSLVLTDPTASRFHLELTREPAGYRVRDLGSTNGTWVNGLRVVEAVLGDQAAIQVGGTHLRFAVAAGHDELPLHPEPRFGRLIGQSAGMRALFAQLDKL